MPFYSWYNQIVIHVSLGIIFVLLYEIFFHQSFYFRNENANHYLFLKGDIKEFYSSVSCKGSNHTNRQCTFNNLCYDSASKDFLFFHSIKSIMNGVPEDRFSPALTDFSSVSDHNTQYFNFIDLPESAFSNFSINFVSGTSLIFKRFNPENLMHVFHDDLIPAFVTLYDLFLLDFQNVYFTFADGRDAGPYSDLYENFLPTKPLYIDSFSSQIICFEKSVVGLSKNSLWYQYGFKQPQGSLNKDMSIIFPILIHFRKYFLKQFSLKEGDTENIALLLNREHNRKIINAESIIKMIEKSTNLKMYSVSLEKYSVLNIIKKILSSKLLIGMHGSLLILSLFLPPKSHVIELFPYGVNPNICTPYKTLTQVPGLELTYHSWENKIEKNTFTHPEYPPELGGILHLSKDEQEYIKKSDVKPFLCCYNHEWLYRIYQDTIVDLYSLSNIIINRPKEYQAPVKYNFNKKLYPSVVQNISCKLNYLDILNISWEKPWNIKFMNITEEEYELWYQDNEINEVKAFIMKSTYFVFKEYVSKNLYVWIRCHIDGRIGPFNANPLICSE